MNPEDRIRAYLTAQKSKVQYLPVDKVVGQVKVFVFYSMSPLKDEQIREIIVRWAMIHCPVMLLSPETLDPGSPGAPSSDSKNLPANSSAMLDSVKKALNVVVEGVTIGSDKENVVIKVTGATGSLKRGDKEASLAISWSGALELKAKSGPFHFTGVLEKDKWELQLTFGRDSAIPDLSKLGKVFSEGEKSMRNLAAEASKFRNIQDANTISALVKPDIKAVQEAAEALSAVADHPKGGGFSFGFKFGSPEPQPGAPPDQMPPGWQGTLVFTYTR